MGTYDEVTMINSLKHKGIRIDSVTKTIKINPDAIYGNGTWGKIDGLTKYHGYTCIKDRNIGKVLSSDNRKPEIKETKKVNKIHKMKKDGNEVQNTNKRSTQKKSNKRA